MRILVISNLYPPYNVGGYEIRCQQTAKYLESKGHDVHVLTSYYGLKQPTEDKGIYRILEHQWNKYTKDPNRWPNILFPHKDVANFAKIVKGFNPDLLYIFNLNGLSAQVLPNIQRMKIAKIFDVGDDWLIRRKDRNRKVLEDWDKPSNKRRFLLIKKSLCKLMRFRIGINWQDIGKERIIFISEDLRRRHVKAGLGVNNSKVIYNAVELELFRPAPEKFLEERINLLYVGQVEQRKGVHVVIEALGYLAKEMNDHYFSLDVVGGNENQEYGERLKNLIVKNHLEDCVRFHGHIDRAKAIAFYKETDIFIFSSHFEGEGFGRTIIEAMAVGVPVVSTLVGGTKDYLQDRVNSLIFPVEDSQTLAEKIRELVQNNELRKSIAAEARKMVVSKFSTEKIFKEKEEFLVLAIK